MSGSPTLAHESATTKEVVNPGGRPPDGLPSITDDTVRERAASPSQLDNLRSSKKGRLDSVDHMEANISIMEADECIPQVGVEPGVALPEGAVKDSYASKVSGNQSKDGANHSFLKDEVLIQAKGGLTRAGITTTNNAISGSRFAALAIEESDPIHVSAQDNGVNESVGNPVRGK
ncbi:hypothetical protein V6N12_002548 [Hibiscus sabdariffa]|uniref:Uncharacterized protein n=1 Tax=Hibiscus sabdariffa TaxID=183260 RepID=A0ABR1ZP71_9ROSI